MMIFYIETCSSESDYACFSWFICSGDFDDFDGSAYFGDYIGYVDFFYFVCCVCFFGLGSPNEIITSWWRSAYSFSFIYSSISNLQYVIIKRITIAQPSL